MEKYLFQTTEFGISDTGIHFLRSGLIYETIRWNEINFVKVERGKELYNWILILSIGIVLFITGLYLSIHTVDVMMTKTHPEYYTKLLSFLLIPGVGLYFIYNAFRVGPTIRINYFGNKKYMFPLREIMKGGQLNDFALLIRNKLGSKSRVSI